MAARETPATRAARAAGVTFELHEYEHDPRADSYALEAATELGLDPDRVFKTLVVDARRRAGRVHRAGGRPAQPEGARQARARWRRSPRAEKVTGYVAGGISPLGQRRALPTFVDEIGVPLRHGVRQRGPARARDRAGARPTSSPSRARTCASSGRGCQTTPRGNTERGFGAGSSWCRSARGGAPCTPRHSPHLPLAALAASRSERRPGRLTGTSVRPASPRSRRPAACSSARPARRRVENGGITCGVVNVTPHRNGRTIKQVLIGWEAPCDQPGMVMDGVAVAQAVKVRRARSGSSFKRRAQLRGRASAPATPRRSKTGSRASSTSAVRSARGTYSGVAVVMRDGQQVDRCATGNVTWRAQRLR